MHNLLNIPLIKNTLHVIKKAVQVIYDISEDAKIRENAGIREKALHDEASLLQAAKDAGRTERETE